MKKPLVNKDDFEPACGLCALGRISPDGDSVLCINTGVRKLDSSCHKFKYDPLKRRPKRMPDINDGDDFKPSDFEI